MDQLEQHLQSLQALKPPGVTKTKIEAITALCVEHVQGDSTIVQKIFSQFKKSPATHKLGVLYVVDSVTRQWVDKARHAGQQVGGPAAEGTFASGVQKVTDLLPVMMNELFVAAPVAQKDKIFKLLDIWERSQTFPLALLAGFKGRLASTSEAKSFTPPGSPQRSVAPPQPAMPAAPVPPTAAVQPTLAAPPASSAQNASSILAAIATLGKTNAAPVPSNSAPAPQPMYYAPQAPVVAPTMPVTMAHVPVAPPPAQAAPAAPAGGNELMMQLIQAVSTGAIPADQAAQAAQIMALLMANQNANQSAGGASLPPAPAAPLAAPPAAPQPAQASRFDQDGHRRRGRSRSPDMDRRRPSPPRRSPPRRRDSPTYGPYDARAAAQGGHASNRHEREAPRGRNRHRGRGEGRQRSPAAPAAPRNTGTKTIEWDNELPPNHIRVLSRTLFVGGANGSESEMRDLFGRFGTVQTCIVNLDKRHAFVKMIDRVSAVAAKEGMERQRDPNVTSKARQTRWGVGFGPRDCSDYATGISVIPINRLTDADRKWVVSAEYGGTGGRAVESGMVIEEPDIEIGGGVSSKAISRRVPADRRGGFGGGRGGFDAPRSRRAERMTEAPRQNAAPSRQQEPGIGVPPPVPGFGYQLPGMP